MRKALTDSRRTLFCVLFYLFEFLLAGAIVAAIGTDPRRGSAIAEAAQASFWLAFTGLLIISFVLRRARRRLAVIGWISLFVAFCSLMMFPIT